MGTIWKNYSFASTSLENGDDAKTVQENLGHHSAAFTLKQYGHVKKTMAVASAQRMEAYIQAPSRFMRKFICRLRLNEVSRQ